MLVLNSVLPNGTLVKEAQDSLQVSQIQKCLPYLRHISETIRRILTPLEIRICLKPHQTLRQLLVDSNSPHAEAKRCVPSTLCIMPRCVYWLYIGTSPQATQEKLQALPSPLQLLTSRGYVGKIYFQVCVQTVSYRHEIQDYIIPINAYVLDVGEINSRSECTL